MSNSIFIPGNTPSSKNSKQWTGRFLVHSKQSQQYYKVTHDFWLKETKNFKDMVAKRKATKPLRVEFTFVRKSRHKFDYVNPLQTVLDLMVSYGWIDDDNADEILPSFGIYSYDKNNPGVHIKLL